MIKPKTKEEIEVMRKGGQKLSLIKEALRDAVAPGATPWELDKMAEKLILAAGGQPSFKTVKNYLWSTCINVNDGVVHGVPDRTPFKNGDIVSVDVGLFYKGFHTDTSFTVPVGGVSGEVKRFLAAGERALSESLDRVKLGNRVSDISRTMERILEAEGYSPVTALTGHGIGRELHEKPSIPCFYTEHVKDERIPEGAALAIEVIYMAGSPELVLGRDGWTLSTKDGKIAALFEETVVAATSGPQVLTA
ncbi:MAG: type I methionyl aminopeptidase [Candidatus Blackburnbacteria bacterium]|nr:type I methionyl aminopeptidase [Candidatus Blackburnbacteria bacterium]